MPQSSKDGVGAGRRYALCVGIGTYTKLVNRNLQYAVADAKAIAEKLGDSQRGDFAVTLLTEPSQTTEQMLWTTLVEMLNAPGLKVEDLVVIYLSCHGDVYGKGNTFYFQPSNAEVGADGVPNKLTMIDIHRLAAALSDTRVKNIIFLLDVCHSGGAGVVLEHLNLSFNSETNLFIIGAARHDQVAIQSSQLRHGVFTSCLLKAFEQKPHRPDGWLTISDIHSFVSEAIKTEVSKLSGQENPVQIQAWSASVNTNLLFTRNPHYSPESHSFHEKVKKLLKLVQYKPVGTNIPEGAPAGYYEAAVKAGLYFRRVGIIPYNNQVEPLAPEYAEKLAHYIRKQVEAANLDDGLIVTEFEVSKEVEYAVKKSGTCSLDIRTYDSIWKNLIDFKEYLCELVDKYQISAPEQCDDPPPSQVYVALHAERRRYEVSKNSANVVGTKSADEFGKWYQVEWAGDLEEMVKRWLSDANPAASRLALLGDYGSGKTTFCQHFAATLAEDYLAAEGHALYQQRIPLLIPLRKFSKNPVDFESYLVACLKADCRVDNADADALMKMAETGLLLFMLDGFDEMASRATTDTIRQNIQLFEKLARLRNNKVLLTTRPEYFLTLHQEQQVLQAYPHRYHLQPFNEKQVNLYLQKRVPFLTLREGEPRKDWRHYQEQIGKIHDLSDLVHRPVLLEMIIKTLPALVAEGKAVNRPNLYRRYLERELDRQILEKGRSLLIDTEKRFEIMEQIALELYRTDKVQLTHERILEVSEGLLTSEQRGEMKGSLREIVTCSFLIRTNDEYRFSHQSFLEYLVAHGLAEDIKHNRQENFRLKPITRTVQDFLLELEVDTVRGSPIATNTDNPSVSFDKKTVVSWFWANPKGKWISSNIISLLARLLPHDQLCKLPLQQADLSNAILTGVDLQKADLQKADLQKADLQEADLQEADLRGADLRGADLQGANLQGANLQGANLQEADFRMANLQEADFRMANLQEADFRKAILRKANLLGADFRMANLQEADFHEVILRGADIRRADFRGANNLSQHIMREALFSEAPSNEDSISILEEANSRETDYDRWIG